MSVIDFKSFKKDKEKEESTEESSVDFDETMKANAEKKKKEAEERIKKNKQVLRSYDIKPKK